MADLRHIVLTSHPSKQAGSGPAINWGAPSAEQRGPVVSGFTGEKTRNVIGAHSGSYSLYRALAVAAGSLDPLHRPDLTNTTPTDIIGPHPQWSDENRIVSIDPYGHVVASVFSQFIEKGMDVRPTIAITKARISVPEIQAALADGRIKPDNRVLMSNGDISVTKVAIEHVWYLPGIARRFGLVENDLRRTLFEYTGGMFPELVTRSDLKVFLPPIGGLTVYIMGELEALSDPKREVACRVHDECNGSDVFGSDICTCRPYLVHGIEICVQTAQAGGAGLVVYNRKEGRALGEVTKFLVYNARKRNPEGDRAEAYFERTECVAGVEDMRFQDLMPDVFHWLGVSRIERFVSMSNMKYDAVVGQGIEIGERIAIPDELIPEDARVEMDAKKAAGYFVDDAAPEPKDRSTPAGRRLDDY